MNRKHRVVPQVKPVVPRLAMCAAFVATGLPWAFGIDQGPDAITGGESAVAPAEVTTARPDDTGRVPLAVARDRAILMHQIYTTTLDVMHHRYFHADRAIVPARAMEDVFRDLERENGSSANWISVNLRAMSVNHDPKTDFEKEAARALGDGRPEYESVEDGVYRRATPIPLVGGCLGCHGGLMPKPARIQKMAGLVISIPLSTGESPQR